MAVSNMDCNMRRKKNANFHPYYYDDIGAKNQDEILTKFKKCDAFSLSIFHKGPFGGVLPYRRQVLRENSSKIGKISRRPASISTASTSLLRSL